MPAHCPGGLAEGYRLHSCGTLQPLWWLLWPEHHSGVLQVQCSAPALCVRNPWWPCLQVIFSCSWRSSSGKLVGPTLVGTWGHVIKGRLVICSVFGRAGWIIWGVTWVKLGAPTGMGACRDICVMIRTVGVKVAIGTEVTESVSSGLKGSSNSMAAGRVSELQMVVVSLACCAGRQWLGWWRKPATIAPWHLIAAGWLLQWCHHKAKQFLLEGVGLV